MSDPVSHPPSDARIPDHELLRPIGRGSYGEVWLARSALGELRAVKLVRRDGRHDDRPFQREFEGLRKFEPISRSHEGLVHILHAGRFEGGFFYVMELADDAGEGANETGRRQNSAAEPPAAFASSFGILPSALASYSPRTLRSELQRRGRLPVAECLALALDLTDALAHLHAQGLVHRDLKPSNIIFVRDRPKLADIGLVASADASMSYVGTEGYLPPEGPGKPPADLFALGKMLYELSTGRDRTDFPELPTQLREDPQRPELEELNEVILRACEPEAHRRYQTAAELRADLLLLKSGRSVRWARGISRRLAMARLAGGVASGLAVLSAGAFWLQRKHAREAQSLRQIAQNLATRSQIQHAEDLFARGESALAMANLARILRHHPGHRVAAERLLAALNQRRFPRLTVPPLPHPDRLRSARFSPDGRWVATISRDQSLRFWNAGSGEEAHPPLLHSGPIQSVAFSPDGRRIVTASADGKALVLEVATGAAAFPPLPHEGPVNAAIFSPKGELIATAAGDRLVRLHDAATGALRQEPLPHEAGVTDLEFGPGGQWLATVAQDASVRIWDIASGTLRQRLALDGDGQQVRVSRDGKWLAVALQHSEAFNWQVQAWNLESRSPRAATLPHENRIYTLAFSPDGSLLVTATANNTARVWELATGKLLSQLPHSAAVYAAEFSPDGRWILTASVDKTARLWDARTWKPVTEAMRHGARVVHAEFSRDGGRVLTASWDHTVRLWEVPADSPAGKTLVHSQRVNSAEFGPTGRQVLTATSQARFTASRINSWDPNGARMVSLWDVDTGRRKPGPGLPASVGIVTARWTQAGPLALIARQEFTREKVLRADPEFSNQARVWDVSAGVPIGDTLTHRHDIISADFTADGSKLAVGTTRGEIRIWDASRGVALGPPLAHAGWINSVRFSPDGTKLVSSSREGSAMIWDTLSGTLLAGPLKHGSEVWFAQFNPAGDRIITATTAHNARIWSVTGVLLADLPQSGPMISSVNGREPTIQWGVCDPVEYAEFSPNGGLVVTAAGDQVRIWDATRGKPLTELAHAQLVVMARFSPDGRRVLAASFDGTAQLWDVATGLKLADPFRHDDNVVSVGFSADGRRAITASTDATARVWDLPSVTLPVPTWLPELAEAVAGQRLDANRISEAVTWAEGAALKTRLTARQSSEPQLRWASALLPGPDPATRPE